MFVVGKRRRFCLRSLPLLLAISISLQWSFLENYCTRCSITFVAICSLHLIKQIGYIQLRWMGAKWIKTMPRKQEERLYSIHTASCCVSSRWAARFLDSRCRARLIAWLSDQHRPRLVPGVFDLLVGGMHWVTSFFLVCCLDSSLKNRYKPI